MALGAENDVKLGLAMHDLRELRVDVAYQFLLELYHDYATGVLPKDDLEEAVRFVEAYVLTVVELPMFSEFVLFRNPVVMQDCGLPHLGKPLENAR